MHLSSSTDATKLYMLVRESLAIAFSTEVPQSMAIEQKLSVWRVRQGSETRATRESNTISQNQQISCSFTPAKEETQNQTIPTDGRYLHRD